MSAAFEYVKKHPFLVGGLAILAVFIAVFLFGGSEEETGAMSVSMPTGQGDNSSVMAGLQIQALGIQAKQAEAEVNAAKDIKLAEFAATTKIKEYEMQTAFHVTDATKAVQLGQQASANYMSLLDFRKAVTVSNNALKLGLKQEDTKGVVANLAYKLGLAQTTNETKVALDELNKAFVLKNKELNLNFTTNNNLMDLQNRLSLRQIGSN